MRSAPTITLLTSPRAISDPAPASATTGRGCPARSSSHAVSRAPWSSGRVSSTQTCSSRPCSQAERSTPTAVPRPPVASAPALQCVSTRSPAANSVRAELAHAAVGSSCSAAMRVRLGRAASGAASDAVERPAQVHGRGPRVAERAGGRLGVLAARGRQRQPVCRGDPDRGRATDRERADRVRHLTRLGAAQPGLLAGKPPLVEQLENAVAPSDWGHLGHVAHGTFATPAVF